MVKFKTSIQLEDADENDNTVLQHELKKQSENSIKQLTNRKSNIAGNEEYNW